jgi:hypothetical protein
MDTETTKPTGMNLKLNFSKYHIAGLFILLFIGAVATAQYMVSPNEITYQSGKSSITFDPVSDQYKKDYHIDYDGKFVILQPNNKNGEDLLSGTYTEIHDPNKGLLIGYNLNYGGNSIIPVTIKVVNNGAAIITQKGYTWMKK